MGILKGAEVGEGATMFAIEKEFAAKKRGATVLAEVFYYDSFRFNASTSITMADLVKTHNIEAIIYYYPGTKLKIEDVFAGSDQSVLFDFYTGHTPSYSLDGAKALEWALTGKSFSDKKRLLVVGINPNQQVSILGISKG